MTTDVKQIRHIAVIPDGNRRWARRRALPTLEGHRRGYKLMKKFGGWCIDRGIEFVSVWGFSTENWKRSKEEVSYLMDLIYESLTNDLDDYVRRGIRLRVIGRVKDLSEKLQEAIRHAEETTKDLTKGQLNLCINYGGRAEILDATKRLIEEGRTTDEITEEMFTEATWFHGIPEPDIIFRTSGESRLSGFLSWLGTYSELFFLKKHWPEVTEQDLDDVIEEYGRRQRRFGA